MLKTGDLITKQRDDGWSAIKILAVDTWEDGSSCAHCLIYAQLPARPTPAALAGAEVHIWHAPIDAQGMMNEGWETLGNQPPTQDDLIGFVEYLRQTDFARYAEATGQDLHEIATRANQHYENANKLGEEGKHEEAIAEYTEAIELFPPFYEAIDNRAFTYMDLGRNREALQDFEESLRQNPDGLAAFFSRGECLMKLGELAQAEAVFAEGQARFPEEQKLFADFLGRVRALAK